MKEKWVVIRVQTSSCSYLKFTEGEVNTLMESRGTKEEAVIQFIEYAASIDYDIVSRLTKESAGEIYPYLTKLKETRPDLFL